MARHVDETKPANRRPRRRRAQWPRVVARLTIIFLVLTMAGLGGCALAVPYLGLPDVRGLKATHAPQSTILFDAKGRRIASLHGEENRTSVPLGQIGPSLPKAVIAMEDARFYQHPGVDIAGLARAVLFFGRRGGGSTLTQQLAKNLYLTQEQTFKRKIADMLLAMEIEKHYTKDQILELYLNQVYWGHGAFGCEAAAQTYFSKHAHDLNLAESAILAGILQGPELYTPYRNPKIAKERQKLVLERMLGQGFITQKEYDAAWQYPVNIHGIRSSHMAPYFTAYVQALLAEKFGAEALRNGGYKIMTSLDLDLQKAAETALTQRVALLRRQKVSQGALVCIDPHSGEIKAMVGGLDYGTSQFNRVVQAHRQPGSSFKPFVYLTALAGGMTPATVIRDEPMSYTMSDGRLWKPQNYDRQFRGDITLRSALEQSVNIVAVKLMAQFGPDRVIATARACGISSPLQPNLSLALGASEVTPLELCSAYGTLATGGKHTPPMAILRIEDRDGKVVTMGTPELTDVYDPSAIAALTDMMQGVLLRGTGRGAYYGKPAAGKTGTTSDSRDAWFAGFTPDLATVVWVGNDDNSPMRGVTGASCAPIWGQFMRVATSSLPARGFPSVPVMAPSDVMGEPSDAAGQPDAVASPLETLDESGQPPTDGTQPHAPGKAKPTAPPLESSDDGLQELPPPGAGDAPLEEIPPPQN